jgi:3-phosphoshikimate 1-carboxyvinyltransferase
VQVALHPSSLGGVLTAPPSKSAMQRACALGLLNQGDTFIRNPGNSNDDLAAIRMVRELGAVTEQTEEVLHIRSKVLQCPGGVLHCGESGLGVRMFAPIAALLKEEVIISGEGSLLNRPLDFFDRVFPRLGVSVQTHGGCLPLKLKGPLQPRDLEVDGSVSSQFLTGLLLAFARATTKQVTLSVTNLKSRPYIDLTLQMMRHFGYEVRNEGYERFIIHPVNPAPRTISYLVEGDWSGAAFLLAGAAIAGETGLHGLDLDSLQADRSVLGVLERTGAVVTASANEVRVAPPITGGLHAFEFDATDCPDLFPPLVALASHCKGNSVIRGTGRLQHKESNRAVVLKEEFGKAGVCISLKDDLMTIEGGKGVNGAALDSHHDHRIAMACAIAALKAKGRTTIDHAEAVTKSYPGFYLDLKMLGADVSLPPTD